MLPYTAYDIIRAVNHEVDLTRPPVREYHHAFGEGPATGPDERGGGGGFPAGPTRGGLWAALRALAARPARLGRPAQAQGHPVG